MEPATESAAIALRDQEEIQTLATEGGAMVEAARLLEVTTPDEFDYAVAALREHVMPGKQARIEFFAPRKGRARAAWQDWIDLEKRALEPFEQAEEILKAKIGSYHQAVELQRQQAEAKARAEQATRELRAKTLAAVFSIHEQIAFAAECMERDRERAELAKAARAAGDEQAAQAITEEIGKPAAAPPVPHTELFVEPTITTSIPERAAATGMSVRSNLKARVVDFHALVRYVAEHPELQGLLKPDQVALDRLAKSMREGIKTIPGIELDKANVVGIRSSGRR